MFRVFPIRSETGVLRTAKAFACLSCAIQIVYSFWKMRVVVFGCTLPWQLLAAHPPGPLYLPAATAFWSYGGVAIAGLDPAFCATLRESGMSSGMMTASVCFRILLSLLTSWILPAS